ncbi:MAG: hypothetical protein HKN20_08495, partial [Gemmatimonadetes bacterium]|nr:hypothetical protein [Gemmatimonadota bacterium]
ETLSANEPLLTKIELLHARAERLWFEANPGAETAQPPSVRDILGNLTKFEKLARGQFQRFHELAGSPVMQPSGARSAIRFSGDAEFGIGTNTATTKIGGEDAAETGISRSTVRANLAAAITANDRVAVGILRNEEVDFAPSTTSEAELRYDRRLGKGAKLHALGAFTGFQNDANKDAEYGDKKFEMGGTFGPTKKFRAKVLARLEGRSFDNIEDADFGDSRLQAELSGKGGAGDWKLKAENLSHDADVDTEDSDKKRIAGEMGLTTGGGGRFALSLFTEGTTFDADDDTRNYTKSGARIEGRSGGAGTKRTVHLSFDRREHDANVDRDYKEYEGGLRSFGFDSKNGARRSSLTGRYRDYEGEGSIAFLDLAEGRWDQSTQTLGASGSGVFWEMNHFFRWYFDNGGFERNAELNQFVWFGLVISPKQAFRAGPFVAGDTELVTVSSQLDPESGDELGSFESPSNSVRYGVKGDARFSRGRVRGKMAGRFETTSFYNLEDSPSPNRLDISGNLEVVLRNDISGSVRGQYFKTGSDDPGALRTSEIDLLFSIIYRFDQTRDNRSGRSSAL